MTQVVAESPVRKSSGIIVLFVHFICNKLLKTLDIIFQKQSGKSQVVDETICEIKHDLDVINLSTQP